MSAQNASGVVLILVLRLSVALALIGCRAVPAEESKKPATNYVHDVWTTKEGLPQNSITAITQTRDGYLWLGTFGGLARFDGVRFTVFGLGTSQDLKSNRVLCLREDREGNLWIGTDGGGLTRFSRGTFTTYTTQAGLPSNTVFSVYEDQAGILWVGTTEGLTRWKARDVTTYTTKDGLPGHHISSILEDRSGNLWVGTDEGVARLRGSAVVAYARRDGLLHPFTWFIQQDRAGTIWAGTEGGLARFTDGRFITYAAGDRSSSGRVLSLLEDRAGTFWIASATGLYRLADGILIEHTLNDGASLNRVRSLHEDREGNLWIGTDSSGLHRLKKAALITHSREDGLPADSVVPIVEDHDGSLWIGGVCAGLIRFQAETSTVTQITGPSVGCVWSLHLDRKGTLWIGDQTHGVTQFKNGKFTTYTTKQGLSPGAVFSIYEDREGSIWIGTAGGLSRFKDDAFTVYGAADGLLAAEIQFITQDRQGALWIGTKGGLSRFKAGTFTNYTTKDGLSHNFVRAIHEDADGILWIGTYGGGLNRYTDGKFTHYTTQEGLFDNIVSRILEDDHGNFWMSGNQGIFRAGRSDLNDFAEGKIRRITSIGYGVSDGMTTSECNGGGQPAGWKTRGGKLWFPTIKGVVAVDPNAVNPLPPLVAVEEVWMDQQSVKPWQPAQRPPGRGDLEIHYTGLSLLAPEKVRFKYQLEGYDQSWVDAGARRVAYYTNIPPGNYRFRVRAMNNDGVWNEAGAAFEFSLAPHFYQTIWFYGLVGVAVVFVGTAGHRYRLRRLVRRTQELETKVAERTTELVEEKNKLAQAKGQLEEANEDMLSVLNELRLGVAMTDEAGRISFLNEAAERLLEKTEDDVLGIRWEVMLGLSDQDRAQLERVAALPEEQRLKVPVHLRTDSGRRYWMEIEVDDDPRDPRRKMVFLYDVSELTDLRRLLDEKSKFHGLVGESRSMRLVYQQVQDVAKVEATVLIEGETGTGKELVARAIHSASPRKSKPFVAVNCAGLTESLLASQLFGHKRGAFTGAVADQVGVFEAASGGTLFLDEIGDMPPSVQTSLLRVLQEKEITRLGESLPRKIDVRVIAATHRELSQEVMAGRFRQDLLYRIQVVRIQLPPLRARREDIPLLVAWFLGQMRVAEEETVREVSQEAMQALVAYDWPGNVRELRSAIESAVVRCQGPIIRSADLPLLIASSVSPLSKIQHTPERQRIVDVLARTGGNRKAAARALGVSRSTFYRWLKDLGV
jgi:transcriptional regulator with PAS, ATPase and Fis domain/ligand-binding sensor domain-containing protein